MFNKKVYDLTIRVFDEVISDLQKKSEELIAKDTAIDKNENTLYEKCLILGKADKYLQASNFLKQQEIEFIEETNKILKKENEELRKVVENNEQNG